MSSTKKVKSVGRFGARFGVGIRKRLIQIEEQQKKAVACPQCGFKKIKRIAPGIFACSKCSTSFAGGAFVPKTLTGSIVSKMVTQKSFLPSLGELLAVKEPAESPAVTGEPTEPKLSKHKKE